MSVNSEINRLNTAKTNIKSAIVDSGVSVPSTASISDYDDYVRAIPDAVLTSADERYKKIQTAVSSPTASSTTSTTFIDTISQDAQGKITATKKTLPAGASCTGTVTSVKVGTTSYSPSSGVVSLPAYPTAADLGLSSALKFIGTTSTALTDGSTTQTVTIGSTSVKASTGDVVIRSSTDKEFVWTGSAWEELGDASSFKKVQTAVSDPTASGTSTTFIKTISQDTQGKITVTKANLPAYPTTLPANGGTADKIGTGTVGSSSVPVYIKSGTPTVVRSLSEAYLSWGGQSINGGITPIDAACSSLHSANRLAFGYPDGITIEYSTNGTSWTAYSCSNSDKTALISGIGAGFAIGERVRGNTVNDKLRITLNATNMGVYTRLYKILLHINTNYSTGCNVIVEKAMKGSETTFSTVGTYGISGWSGWNSIPIGAAFGGGSTQTSNIAVLRLTFGITGVNSDTNKCSALQVLDIVAIGDTYWTIPSTLAKTGHLYSYNSSGDATFPANVTATTFIGALSGNAASATKATKDADGNNIKTTYLKIANLGSYITAAAGSNINSVGTPSVTASTSNGVTTFTFNYLKGATGNNGTSCTHSWSGTTLSVTSASGTSSANLKGATGNSVKDLVCVTASGGTTTGSASTADAGTSYYRIKDSAGNWLTGTIAVKNGSKGTAGTSVTITNVSQNTSAGGTSTVTFSDGKTLSIKNGSNGTNATTTAVTSSSANGLAPKVINSNTATVGTAYYVLASSNGSAAPSWYKLPSSAFSTNSWRDIYVNGTKYSGSAIDLAAGSNVSLTLGTADNGGKQTLTIAATNTNTTNTAGSSNKTGTKLLLVGATSTTTGQTYTNSKCYIGTDNCLYSGGTKVLTSHQSLSGYLTSTTAASTYLAKAGGTTTGLINLNGNTYNDTLKISNKDYAAAYAQLFMAGGNDFVIRQVIVNGGTTVDLRFNESRLSYTKNLSIGGAATITGAISAQGAKFYTNANGVYWTSDRKFKDCIKSPVKNGMLDDETGLIRKFNWKDTGKASCGFIAQELLPYVPEAVDYDKELNKYSVNYDVAHSALLGQLVIKIKELESEIKSLKSKIN